MNILKKEIWIDTAYVKREKSKQGKSGKALYPVI